MDFVLMTEPHLGGTYEQLLAAARWAREQGMVAFARSDHYYSGREPAPPATDAFATVAGLARETEAIRLCVLVSPITFRHPAVIAKNAATIDEMSGGRFDLGVGTGWMDLEHAALGIPFPPWTERFDRLTEALQYLRAAFSRSPARFEGEHYRLDADVRPRPQGIRLIVGGSGKERTPVLAGTYADEYNHFLTSPEDLAPKIDLMRATAEREGRDPAEIVVSVMGQVFTGRDEREYRELIGQEAQLRDIEPAEMERRIADNHLPHGPPEVVGEALAGLERVGVDRLYLQWLRVDDLAGLASVWEGVRLAVR